MLKTSETKAPEKQEEVKSVHFCLQCTSKGGRHLNSCPTRKNETVEVKQDSPTEQFEGLTT